MTKDVTQLLRQLYVDFNARNIERIMPHFAADADWPNGMTGGREVGHDAIRGYWTNQWTVINSQVTPISYRFADGYVILEVRQRVTDMEGETLSDGVVYHTYSFTDGKIARMDISADVPEVGASVDAIPA